jgi:pimeloyl-ACP methyl ester carboxylesterase
MTGTGSSRILVRKGSVPTLLYLHGLASSPKGRKKAMLEERFGPEGFAIAAPDLNVPSFQKLSFDEMYAEAFVAFSESKPRLVIGSSLGALVALSLADTLGRSGPPLVLIAPALAFGERGPRSSPRARASRCSTTARDGTFRSAGASSRRWRT